MVFISFTNPLYLWTLAVLPIIILVHVFSMKRIREAALRFSNFEAIERVAKGNILSGPNPTWLWGKNLSLLMLRLLIYVLLVLSVTGTTVWYTKTASDFDYMMAIDTSTSMLAQDFNGTRLDAAKKSALRFTGQALDDASIGLVSFASAVFIDQEPTTDREAVSRAIRMLEAGEGGGTNIGDAIVTSTNFITNRGTKDKAIILITDGQSNTGTPVDRAADYAYSKNVVVHTLGIGTEEGGRILNLNITSRLDEESLKLIAGSTDGLFFRVENEQEFSDAFGQITEGVRKRTALDISLLLLIVALIVLSVEWVLLQTVFKTIP
jgi:Ca-activated chloride channel homolog